MRSLDVVVGVAAALAVLGCAAPQPMAQTATKVDAKFGKPISEADIASWNIDIRTADGRGLPVGHGSVAEGKAIYEAKCLACHGAEAKGGSVYGPMVGGPVGSGRALVGRHGMQGSLVLSRVQD